MTKFVATISRCVQVSPDDFHAIRVSNVFDTSQAIDDVFKWMEAVGKKNPTVNDLVLSELDQQPVERDR